MASANLIVVGSLEQRLVRGDLHHAVAAELVDTKNVIELGSLLGNPEIQRNSDDITVADLTGLAVQDICMANHIIQALPEST